MNTDKSVQNQKVFVKLENVLALQRRYTRSLQAQAHATTETAAAAHRGRREAFEEVIALLELPIRKEDPDGK